MALWNVLKALWNFHKYLFLKIPIEVSSFNVNLTELPILLSCHGGEEMNGVKTCDGRECFVEINSTRLRETVCDKVCLVSFD